LAGGSLSRTLGGWPAFALASLPPQSRRGAAFGDINNDGNVDIVVLNVGEPPSLLAEPHCERESPRAVQISRNEKQ
jgi:hypothetical protein